MAIRFAIREGRITTEPFDLKIGDVGVNLSGSTGLDQTIDYQAKVAIPGGGVLADGRREHRRDVHLAEDHARGEGGAVEEAVTNVVNEQLQKLTGSESLSEEIAKQADNIRAEARNAGQKLVEAAQTQRDKLVEEAAKKGTLAKLAGAEGRGQTGRGGRETGCKPRSRGRAPDRETHCSKGITDAENLCRPCGRYPDGAPAAWPAPLVSQPLITVIIWALLFLLGLEAGSDPAVVGDWRHWGSGLRALRLFGGGEYPCGVGAVAVDRPAEGCCRVGDAASGLRPGSRGPRGDRCGGTETSTWESPEGELTIVAFFVAGCAVGVWAEPDLKGSAVSTWVLYALMFCVGMTLGNDRTLVERIRQLDKRRLALLPVATAVGTLGGALLAARRCSVRIRAVTSAADSLAVGAGFGYYSLSSIFIADLRGAELATVALLCNILRELFTLLAAPLVARCFGPLAAVSIGGRRPRHDTPDHHTRGGTPLRRGVDLPRLCAGFQRASLVTLFCSL